MPLKDRISTILHLHTASMASHSSQPTIAASLSPPRTPASSTTSSIVKTDPAALPSPSTTTTTVYTKSSIECTPITSPTSPLSNGTLSPRAVTSRFASRLSTFPKRILRSKPNHSHTHTLSGLPTISQTSQSGGQPSRGNWPGKGHKHTKSAGTYIDTSTLTQAQELPTALKQPLTNHQPTPVSPGPAPTAFQNSPDTLPEGPHPGKPYDPYARQPTPQPKTAADCWDDDPPFVRRRLQGRHWEVLFSDFNWSPSTQPPKPGRGRMRHNWGDVSPRSRSPRTSTAASERDSLWMREEELRARDGERERDWDVGSSHGQQAGSRSGSSFWKQAGSSPGPSLRGSQCSHGPFIPEPGEPSPKVLQARELAEKLARIRMKK